MVKIQQNFINVQGLKLHIAELGSAANVVPFSHGFPEIWYSWRHQMVAVADCSVPRHRTRLQRKPGRAEGDFEHFDPETVVKNVYILFSKSEILIAKENEEIMDLVDPSTALPSWFSDEDLSAYGAFYEKSGFQTALKVPYRSMDEESDIADPVVKLPALLIIGCKDYVFKFPGIEDFVKSGKVKEFVPNLDVIYLPEGTHFVLEQSPELVKELILDFLKAHS